VIEMDTVSIGSLHDPGASVIEAIEWTVRKGEFWVIAGHNGSGKSDLLLTLAGLMAPLAGRYRCLGEPMPILEDARPGHRLKVGLVFGGGRLLNRLNLGDNVALPVRYHEDLDEASALHRVMPILQATGLTPMAARMPGTLGRHWHQRAGLARALATHPELLLLDDPLSGLDSPHAAWWIRFLQDAHGGRQPFCSRDMTLVLATDTLAPWRQVATHCALLEAGRLVSMGCPNAPDVSGHPKIREYSGPGRWTFDPAG
jgi:ABC-type transporter Mla maintaining outer membrane lipid asymmetry ATPase subunit MlaF